MKHYPHVFRTKQRWVGWYSVGFLRCTTRGYEYFSPLSLGNSSVVAPLRVRYA